MANPERKGWKETIGKVAIAGGIVAGALGLLAQSTGVFIVGILGVSGGYYFKTSK